MARRCGRLHRCLARIAAHPARGGRSRRMRRPSQRPHVVLLTKSPRRSLVAAARKLFDEVEGLPTRRGTTGRPNAHRRGSRSRVSTAACAAAAAISTSTRPQAGRDRAWRTAVEAAKPAEWRRAGRLRAAAKIAALREWPAGRRRREVGCDWREACAHNCTCRPPARRRPRRRREASAAGRACEASRVPVPAACRDPRGAWRCFTRTLARAAAAQTALRG